MKNTIFEGKWTQRVCQFLPPHCSSIQSNPFFRKLVLGNRRSWTTVVDKKLHILSLDIPLCVVVFDI